MDLRSARRRAAARSLVVLISSLVTLAAGASRAWACACGCDLFDVGSSSMFPQGKGIRLSLEYDFQDQHENWDRSSRAPGYQNPDKQIETHFVTFALQWMVTPEWGFQVEVPYEVRHFVTTGGSSGTDNVSLNYNDFGDIRVKGIFDGFFEDHSAGVTFGFKLPTGNYTFNDRFGDVDRDSEIGTGSVDVLVGGFYHQGLTSWCMGFVQMQLDAPVIDRDRYHPGLEFDIAQGVTFDWSPMEDVTLHPLLQFLESARTRDTGKASADPVASGFARVFVSPGLEVDVGPVMIYADVEVPVYQYMNGNQLVAPVLWKAMVSYRF